MKYEDFMQADEKQMYEWVKTGKASFRDFEKWFDENMDKSREVGLDAAYYASQYQGEMK